MFFSVLRWQRSNRADYIGNSKVSSSIHRYGEFIRLDFGETYLDKDLSYGLANMYFLVTNFQNLGIDIGGFPLCNEQLGDSY
jgi:hypothetical protein